MRIVTGRRLLHAASIAKSPFHLVSLSDTMTRTIEMQGNASLDSNMVEVTSCGEWVRRARKALDLTQAALAQQVGCATVTISKIERDERRPSLQMAELLAEHLAIPDAERDNFIRLARGKFVSDASFSPPTITPPDGPMLREQEEAERSDSISFVGRTRELAQLNSHLLASLHGSGRVVFISGEAGTGKTTLMGEFGRRAQMEHNDLFVAGGSCGAFDGVGDPYLPFRDALSSTKP